MDPGAAIVVAAALVVVGIVGVHAITRRKAVLADPGVEHITVMIGRMQQSLNDRLDRMQEEILKDLNNLHERLEYLEERDRGRP